MEKLLEELEGDWVERLRWVVCRRLGILPGSVGFRLMTGRRAMRYACHMVLDARAAGAAEREAEDGGGFDMERFRELKGAGL